MKQIKNISTVTKKNCYWSALDFLLACLTNMI